jgi:HipA-like protein
MRQGKVYNNNVLAGIISELANGEFLFEYDDTYFENPKLPAISIHFQKLKKQYRSKPLFPFFYNLISEGANKKIQSIQLKIDEDDAFGFLLKTSAHETIGAIRVEEVVP